MMKTQSQTQSTRNLKMSKQFFDQPQNVLGVSAGVGGLVCILFLAVVVALCMKFKARRGERKDQNITECQSPIYCEVDMFQNSSSEFVNLERVDTEINDELEDECCYPESIEDKYENMDPASPGRDSVEYNYPYTNTLALKRPTKESVEDDYEYPQTRTRTSESEYSYAYQWLNIGCSATILSSSMPTLGYTPPDKDKDEVEDNLYENYQALSRESLEIEDENETVFLEYVTIV